MTSGQTPSERQSSRATSRAIAYEAPSHFDFVGKSKRWYTISAIVIAVSIVTLVIAGLNLGIEFRGGVSIQADNASGVDLAGMRSAMEEIGLDQAVVQLVNGGEAIRIETPALDEDGQNQFRQVVSDVTGAPRAELNLKAVEPRFGALIARQALIALGAFLAAVALFISWRLEFKMALAGLAALAHDLIVTAGVYAVTRFEVTTATIVAILTILGYSLYDTVVVFDRVTEVDHHADPSVSYGDVVNTSMNQVLVRSIATSLTSLLPIGSLLFVGSLILGAATLRDFALALFVGIASGTYSSLFVAAPLLAAWKSRESNGGRAQIERRGGNRGRGEGRPPAAEPKVTPPRSARAPRPPRPPRPPKGGR